MSSKRKQIHLEPASDETLKEIARETGIPQAEHIRRAVRVYIDRYARTPAEDQSDPLLQLIGICDSSNGPKNAALHHDHYLSGRRS